MIKWEYYVSEYPSLLEVTKLGAQGWELCAIDKRAYIFKRSIEQQEVSLMDTLREIRSDIDEILKKSKPQKETSPEELRAMLE